MLLFGLNIGELRYQSIQLVLVLTFFLFPGNRVEWLFLSFRKRILIHFTSPVFFKGLRNHTVGVHDTTVLDNHFGSEPDVKLTLLYFYISNYPKLDLLKINSL